MKVIFKSANELLRAIGELKVDHGISIKRDFYSMLIDYCSGRVFEVERTVENDNFNWYSLYTNSYMKNFYDCIHRQDTFLVPEWFCNKYSISDTIMME